MPEQSTDDAIKRFLKKGGKIQKVPFGGRAKFDYATLTGDQKRYFKKLKRSGYTSEQAFEEAKKL